MPEIKKVYYNRNKHIQSWILLSNPYYVYDFFRKQKESGVLNGNWTDVDFLSAYKSHLIYFFNLKDVSIIDAPCVAADTFSVENDTMGCYCDWCPYDLNICSLEQKSIFEQYSKMMNWSLPKLFEKKIPSYDSFRQMGVTRQFSWLCLQFAFAPILDKAFEWYDII